MITLLHNPRCSKSRQGLALLEEKSQNLQVQQYLKDSLDAATVRSILEAAEDWKACLRPADLKKAGVDVPQSLDEAVDVLLAHPSGWQRPIAFDGSRAIVGRPPEDLLQIL